jgi:hypothetical protein
MCWFCDGASNVTRYGILGLCAVAAFVTLASKPTAQGDHLPDIATIQIVQMSDDPATVDFIRIYLGHGWQFDPE